MTVLIDGMKGFGDNIYQRAFIKSFKEDVYIKTPWPELYQDLDNVKVVRSDTTLRTQALNEKRHSKEIWHNHPTNARRITVQYGTQDLKQGSIISGMQRCLGVAPSKFDLPDFGESQVKNEKPIAVIRPATVRSEWRADSRNPNPQYLELAAAILSERGYHVVSVAHLQDKQEWMVGKQPYADEVYHQGEFKPDELLALVSSAACVVGGVGWIVPACFASGTDLYCVLGGNGGNNSPKVITPKGKHRIHYEYPDDYCMCQVPQHNCNKKITGFEDKFTAWINTLTH